MKNRIENFLKAACVPASVESQEFGDWQIRRLPLPLMCRLEYDREEYTCLIKYIEVEPDWENMHKVRDDGKMLDVVMEDSPKELKRHLPIWLAAHGHVLKTGLGLGCVVRGLLIKPEVTKISVIEIDAQIIEVIGKEFAGNPRVEIHHGDALTFDTTKLEHLDFAWHDIWTPENEGLQIEHAKLILKYGDENTTQGAWQYPRFGKRIMKQSMSVIG